MSSKNEEKIDHCGFLKKKGDKNKSYRKRFFKLIGERLYYYKNKNSKKSTGLISIGTDVKIKINNNENKKKKDEFTFTLEGKELKRSFQFKAEDEEDLEKWVIHLKRAIARAKNTFCTIIQDEDGTPTPHCKLKMSDFDDICTLGFGNYSKVIKVRKKDTKEIFAMKIFKKEEIIYENFVNHIMNEKDILSMLDNNFIVPLHFAFQSNENLYLVLEFLSGGDLSFHLKEEGKFSIEKARFYLSEIILAIEYLHRKNIIYRDLKPENCMFNYRGHINLSSFGLAKNIISIDSSKTTFCGTPEYLAPEILKGAPHSKSVDWWSLGILFYEMLTGEPPFYSDNVNEIYELILKSTIKYPKHIPKDARDLLSMLLQKDPEKRLGSGYRDSNEIKAHEFFKKIEWEKMIKLQRKPPFIPNLRNDLDYFEKIDGSMKYVKGKKVSKYNNEKFLNYYYTKKGKIN